MTTTDKFSNGKPVNANATTCKLENATDADLELIGKSCGLLQMLDLQGSKNLTDVGLGHLSGLQKLRTLNLNNCDKITDAGLQHLTGLKQLQSLNFGSCKQITDAGLEHIAVLDQLQTLILRGCDKVTDAGLQRMASLQQLQELSINGCKLVTDASLPHIAVLEKLHTLDLGGCDKITDAGVQRMSGLCQLRTLNLGSCKQITDAGLQLVASLQKLNTPNLFSCVAVTDAGLQYISGMKQLQSLTLWNCDKITDAGLKLLTGLPLHYLDLDGCSKITDAGLEHLASLKLSTLYIKCDKISVGGALFAKMLLQFNAERARATAAEAARKQQQARADAAEKRADTAEGALHKSTNWNGRADRGLKRLRALRAASRAALSVEYKTTLLNPRFLVQMAAVLDEQEQARAGILRDEAHAASQFLAAPLTAAQASVLRMSESVLSQLFMDPVLLLAVAAMHNEEDAQRNALERGLLREHNQLLHQIETLMRRGKPLGSAEAVAVKDELKMFVHSPELLRCVAKFIAEETRTRDAMASDWQMFFAGAVDVFMRDKPPSREEALARAAALQEEVARLRKLIAGGGGDDGGAPPAEASADAFTVAKPHRARGGKKRKSKSKSKKMKGGGSSDDERSDDSGDLSSDMPSDHLPPNDVARLNLGAAAAAAAAAASGQSPRSSQVSHRFAPSSDGARSGESQWDVLGHALQGGNGNAHLGQFAGALDEDEEEEEEGEHERHTPRE
jgi:hypothetical protein